MISDFVKTPIRLQSLNLSTNFIEEIDSSWVTKLHKLITIDLSYNKLTTLSTDVSIFIIRSLRILKDNVSQFLLALHSVELLNLQGNEIFNVQSVIDRNSKIKTLNLSRNKLTLITATMFSYFANSL